MSSRDQITEDEYWSRFYVFTNDTLSVTYGPATCSTTSRGFPSNTATANLLTTTRLLNDVPATAALRAANEERAVTLSMDKFLVNPRFNAWVKYVDQFNAKFPDKKIHMIGLLTKTYGDEALSKTLEMAMNVKSTSKIAKRLRNEQLQTWKADGKSADEIFTLLGLDKVGNDLLITPQLNTWFTYTAMTNTDNAIGAMISILRARYGDSLGQILVAAKPRVPRMEFIATRLQGALARANAA
ncbi:unnamed protein product [Phytophthora lilii]|uniref:Unnamed protein product n=1 Tax=Phytophthora lilii TaxID=2077276 RepID=A0A9W6WZK3_9STRA|nr:unnamed protein product [Phytophthora lilii]